MSSPEIELRVQRLREEFDGAFAAPRPPRRATRLRVLMVRVGATRLALRLQDVGGLHKDRPLVAVPGGAPGLLGLAGVRGRLVAVFSLASLLGLTAASEPLPYFVQCAARPAMGLAFARLEAWRELDSRELKSAAAGDRHIGPYFSDGSASRGIVDLASLLEAMGAGGL